MDRDGSIRIVKLYCNNCGQLLAAYLDDDKSAKVTCPRCRHVLFIHKGRRFYEIKIYFPKNDM